MEARALLQATATAYAGLRTLDAEIRVSNETDEGATGSHYRVKALYAAPDRYRFETVGKRADVIVTNEAESLHYWAGMKQFRRSSSPVSSSQIRGLFNPDFPGGVAYLFPRIAEKIANVEIVREELAESNGTHVHCVVLEASYDSLGHAPWMATGPVSFWINSETGLVLRMECASSRRAPAEDEITITRQTLEFMRLVANESIDSSMFVFEPPKGALDMSNPAAPGCFIGTGGGGGSAHVRPDGSRFERRSSSTWIGETLVESSKMKIHGLTLEFDRRYSFSDDKRDLRIEETVSGPLGESKLVHSIPLERKT
jgi:outer membrane lipoprotein-sorting protein